MRLFESQAESNTYPRDPVYLSWHRYHCMYRGRLDMGMFLCEGVRAEAIIDSATHGRVKRMAELPREVELLCFDLIENHLRLDRASRGITSRSQSVDGVSESENYKADADKEVELDALIFSYLGNVTDDNGTPLLYRGCSV